MKIGHPIRDFTLCICFLMPVNVCPAMCPIFKK